MTGVPPPAIHRQLKYPRSNATTTGATVSPTLPAERCNDMNNPRRSGNRWASSPRAGGCHRALPADATTSAARISP